MNIASFDLFSINTSATYPLYLAYRNAGASPDLIVPAILVNLRAGTANFLMLLICLFEVGHQSGQIVFLVIVASGTNFVGLFKADLFVTPMIFCVNANMMAMFCASSDRLFAIASPFKHKQVSTQHKFVYLFCHTLLCALFGLYSLFYVLSYGIQNSGIPTTGCICEILSNDAIRNRYFINTTLLNLACIVCYVIIGVLIRCKKGVTVETNTRLLRSLKVILLVSVGGYLFNLSVYQLAFTFQQQLGPYVRIWQFTFVAAIFLNISAAANAPILYMNSTEYRKAFKREFGKLRRLFPPIKRNASVSPSTANAVHVEPRQQQQSIQIAANGVRRSSFNHQSQSFAVNRF
uniref:G_PROTEIN_RECEP_F1_2 domain-containing protein n=1 Tax=Globodera pallida TaxID=36090 RepID=A0A183BT37_GLOPA